MAIVLPLWDKYIFFLVEKKETNSSAQVHCKHVIFGMLKSTFRLKFLQNTLELFIFQHKLKGFIFQYSL